MTASAQPETSSTHSTGGGTSGLHILYGADQASATPLGDGLQVQIPIPCLGEVSDEHIALPSGSVAHHGHFTSLHAGGITACFASLPMEGNLSTSTRSIYGELFEITRGQHLYRIWNYLPQINERSGGLEVYRQFNIGRWQAFESAFGSGHEHVMPAASAVGARGDQMVILALSGSAPPLHLENPEQIPAYRYPTEHGPRSPGFARASLVEGENLRTGFLSGTASIIGHQSVGAGDLALQFNTTITHITRMLEKMEITEATGSNYEVQIKCYLRNRCHVEKIQTWLHKHLNPRWDSHIVLLEADICRRELDLEIEGIFVRGNQMAASKTTKR